VSLFAGYLTRRLQHDEAENTTASILAAFPGEGCKPIEKGAQTAAEHSRDGATAETLCTFDQAGEPG
jgi:hypothetical protein